jgi:PAS domain S-box-containing protein
MNKIEFLSSLPNKDRKQAGRAEKMQQNTLQRFYLMLASMHSGVLLMTEAGRIEFVNQAFCDACGLKETPDDLTGLASNDLLAKIQHVYLHPDKAAARIREIIERGLPVRGEEFEMRDGRKALRDFVPLKINGQSCGRLWIHTNISALKKAETAEQAGQDRFHAALSNMSFGALLVNENNQIDFANQAFCDIFNLKESSEDLKMLTSREILEKIGPAYLYPDKELARIVELVDQGVLVQDEEVAMQGERTFLRDFIPIRSGSSRYGRLWLHKDITERKRMEAALYESEQLYRAIGESIDFGVWVCAPDGRNVYASQSFLKLVGLTQDQCSNYGWGDVLHPEDAERTLAAWKECIRTEELWDIEHRFRGVDGRWHPILARGVPVRDGKGRIKCWAGINLDISRQKQAEDSLRKAKEELELRVQERMSELTEALHTLRQTGAYTRSLIEASLDPLVTIGRDGKIADVNAATETVTGRARQELIGTDFSIYFTEPEMARTGYQQVFKDGSVRDYPLEIRHRDGRTNPVLYNAALYRDESGQVAGIFAAARDISQRKRAEEALRQSEQEFRALAEAVPQIVWTTRPDGWNIYFNQKWVDYTGLSLEESYGHGWNTPFHPDDRRRAWEAWEHATKDDAPYSLECRLRRADGIYRWWLIRGEPMRGANGRILKWFGTCTDIEDLKQASEQLRRITSELMVAEQHERQRLAQVLHDGLQQILVAAKFRLAYVPRSQNVRHATDEVLELIDDAIETSRSLTAELSPPILLQGDLFLALEWLARWMHDKHELEVTLLAGKKIEPLKMEIILLLFQAARELLFNVVKHAGVKAARVDVNQVDGQIVMTIGDEGAGFDPNHFRAEGGPSGGTGLFGIRERLFYIGGHMDIDSAPGQGSRFRLIVPHPSIAVETDQPSAWKQGRVSVAVSAQLDVKPAGARRKIRIVLVDDHMVMRQGLAGLLRMEPDFEIAGEASDGESAVGLIREIRPDVVLMDISMPGMDGIQATRIIHEELPEIRVIGLSMFQEGAQQAAMRDAGAVGYLTKSGPSEALIETIRTCFRASGKSLTDMPSKRADQKGS